MYLVEAGPSDPAHPLLNPPLSLVPNQNQHYYIPIQWRLSGARLNSGSEHEQ